jgi:hypothetical protein
LSGEIQTTQVLDRLLPDLHTDSYANLTFWSKPQLVQYLDDAAKQLSRAALLFIERDTSQSTVPGTATYPLPTRHNATLHISFATTPLRPGTTIELESRDRAFQTTPGNPDHWYEDDLAIASIALAPVPTTAAPLPMICAMYPPDLDTGQVNTLLQAPAPVAIHLSYFVLAKAYGSESETEEPDLANHAGAMVAMLEQVFQHLWGEGV